MKKKLVVYIMWALFLQPIAAQKVSVDSGTGIKIRIDSTQMALDAKRNGEAINDLLNKNKKNQKRNALVRIGIGAGFFIILIIGLRRKGNKGPVG